MVKNIFAVFVMAAITAVLSTVAWGCEVRSGANRGWVYSGDAVFYYDEYGEEYSGMHVMPEDGTRRYFDEETHIMATGETEIDGSKYMFDADGVMMTGFQTVNGALRYYSVERIGLRSTAAFIISHLKHSLLQRACSATRTESIMPIPTPERYQRASR